MQQRADFTSTVGAGERARLMDTLPPPSRAPAGASLTTDYAAGRGATTLASQESRNGTVLFADIRNFSGLAEMLRLEHPLQPQEALGYLRQIAEALVAVHARGIVHRDLKPDNLMLREDGTLVLADFGIAKDLSRTMSSTRKGEGLGTPYYLSPEQATGGKVDQRSDLYSLGVIFYEMLRSLRSHAGCEPEAVEGRDLRGVLCSFPRLRGKAGMGGSSMQGPPPRPAPKDPGPAEVAVSRARAPARLHPRETGRPTRWSRGPVACDGDATRDGRMGPPTATAAFAVRSPTSWGPSSALRRPLLHAPARLPRVLRTQGRVRCAEVGRACQGTRCSTP